MSDLNPETTFEEIFENAIEIEKTAGQIYAKFAKMFSSFPNAANFWKEMDKDESDHARWLIEIKESLSDKELSSSPDYDLILKVHHINKLLEEYSSQKIENLDDAYELANDIESSEVNNLFSILTHKFIPSEEKRKFLLSEINEHQLKIMDFPKNFGDKILREEIKAEEI
ncbi:MAG: ferritin family protein [candidate division WOR-3 bacterium]